MIIRVLISIILILTFSTAHSQQGFKIIIGEESGNPVSDVLVFQEGTSNFSFSDHNGVISFIPLNVGKGEIILSHINYVDKIISKDKWLEADTISLHIDPVLIDEVVVNAQKSKKRKDWVKSFENGLLGITKNRKNTKILNIEDVLFAENENGIVSAIAQDVIRIENRSLGYHIMFLLEEYSQYPSGKVTFKGKPVFTQLPFDKDKDLKKWNEQRKKTFEMSIHQVLKNMALDLDMDNVEFSIAELINNREFTSLGKADITNFLTHHGDYLELKIPRFLAIENRNIKMPKRRMSNQSITGISRPAEREMAMHTQGELEFSSGNATTFLFSRSRSIKFDKNGIILNPEHISMYGYHGTWGIADMLPFEYFMNKIP